MTSMPSSRANSNTTPAPTKSSARAQVNLRTSMIPDAAKTAMADSEIDSVNTEASHCKMNGDNEKASTTQAPRQPRAPRPSHATP